MDKAARAVRRGTVRLSSTLGSGHSGLKLIISEKKNVRQTLKAYAKAQQSASSYLLKWGESEELEAIQDVATHLAELNACWTEVQKEMIEAMKINVMLYDKILDAEKSLDQSKKQLDHCLSKEKKLKKDIEKAEKKGEDTMALHTKLERAQQATELAQAEVNGRSHETQCIKLTYFQTAVKEYAQGFQLLSSQASAIFQAQEKLVALIPETQSRDTTSGIPRYEGTEEASAIVNEARGQLRTCQTAPFFSSLQLAAPSPSIIETDKSGLDDSADPPPSYKCVVRKSQSPKGEDADTIGWGSDEFSD